MPFPPPLETARGLLCALGDHIRDTILDARSRTGAEELSAVAGVTPADTIYRIDRIGEAAILAWFEAHWPAELPVEIVMEGIDDQAPPVFPTGATPAWRCLIDPIDGTRLLMTDKRPAWALAALAPCGDATPRAGDIAVAAMTELPTTRQWRSDQFSAVRGGPVVATFLDLRDGTREAFTPRPSTATDFRQGFASFARFLPGGLDLTGRIEDQLWTALYPDEPSPPIFTDQLLASGGQLVELLCGRDRMVGDLRPLVYTRLGLDTTGLTCHPYDLGTALIAQQACVVVEQPDGSPLNFPLDTTTPVAWMGYANETLAKQVRPVLQRLIGAHLEAIEP